MDEGMIIIATLGRTGSTLILEFLRNMGFYIGNNLGPKHYPRTHSGLQHGWAQSITQQMNTLLWKGKLSEDAKLKTGETIQHAILHFVDNKTERPVIAIKTPEMSWNPILVKMWGLWHPASRFLIMARDFKCQKLSMEKHFNQVSSTAHPKRKTLEEYQIDFANMVVAVLSTNRPYSVLLYPEFLSDFNRVYNTLSLLGIKMDIKKAHQVWEKTVDLNLVSHFDE